MTHSEQRPQNSMLLSAVDLPPLKILLAEDNLTNQKVALKQLQSLGCKAEAVADGRKAVEAIIQSAQTAVYEVVLMDCQMPVMDGYSATQAIRNWEKQALSQRDRIIVIAMTASDLAEDRERAIAAGMDDFISKPVRREALAGVLQRWSQVIIATRAETTLASQSLLVQPEPLDSHLMQFFPASEHLDLMHLHLLSDNNPEFELELLQLFVEDSAAQLSQMQQAIAIEDFNQVEQTAHHIKGASANVGAKTMQAAAAQLELRACRKQLGVTDSLLSELKNALQHIKDWVERAG
ncbi:MAG: response regulator [Oscillatoriophycideae cyanobacterium NC_groundwater_1537_Pr4_S-0.65um_50_18]|nr:response regulator [Oscillatoriophycideae cyanobacterium NC_groundwater_1537_Pr4_S-0.65um_50_18]